MLQLPKSVGEWGFVIVLSVLFCGLAFAIIYSQVHLHGMRKQQAYADTESNLNVLAEQVRAYYEEHGRVEPTLTDMGVDEKALETRHASFTDEVSNDGATITLTGTLKKYDSPTCSLTLELKNGAPRLQWAERMVGTWARMDDSPALSIQTCYIQS